MCLNPRRIVNKRKDFNPSVHSPYQWVKCGYCAECRKEKREDAESLILMEAYKTLGALGLILFLTFTYDDAHLPVMKYKGRKCKAFSKQDVIRLLDQLRRFYDKKHLKFSYYVVSEYGDDKKRPHYHIMFFIPKEIDHVQFSEKCRQFWTDMFIKDKQIHVNNGWMFPARHDVLLGKDICRDTAALCAYTTKYVCKDISYYDLKLVKDLINDSCSRNLPYYKNHLPFTHHSKNFGITIMDYVEIGKNTYTNPVDLKVHRIPRYAVEKACYKFYRGDELNDKGERKVVRELTDYGSAFLQASFENRVQDTYLRYFNYAKHFNLPYDSVDCYCMSVYSNLYRGMLAGVYEAFASTLKDDETMFDYDVIPRVYKFTQLPQKFQTGDVKVTLANHMKFASRYMKDIAEKAQYLDSLISDLKESDYVIRVKNEQDLNKFREMVKPEQLIGDDDCIYHKT